MSTLAKALRSRREQARNRRRLANALDNATPAVRDELLILAQRQDLLR